MLSPNFLIIGGAKAGTSSLCLYLQQHPDIFMAPVKESCFFAFQGSHPCFCGPGDERINRRIICDPLSYARLFDSATGERSRGEASVWYLYDEKAPSNIAASLPNTKLIAILRNPIERAFSSYMMAVRERREPLPFPEALDDEERRIRRGWEYLWHYRQAGFYGRQIATYLRHFRREQLCVFLYEDFKRNPEHIMQQIFRFVEVDDSFVPNFSRRVNASGIPKSRALHRWLKGDFTVKRMARKIVPQSWRSGILGLLEQQNLDRSQTCAPQIRERLLCEFREDIEQLQDILGISLSEWLSVQP